MRRLPCTIAAGLVLTAGASAGCVSDVVLPNEEVTATCGNGVVERGEACDVQSPGCVACLVAPTWTCDATGCTTSCGDGVVAADARCTAPRREATCAMDGYWAIRQSTYLREPILGGLQVSSNWFFFRLAQEGDAFRVLEALDCGILVTGSATVRYSPASLRAILHASGMDGSRGRPARRGAARPAPGGGCTVSFDRWYAVRGLDDTFLPQDFLSAPDLTTLPPLPTVADPASPGPFPSGTVDPDADGLPGLSFRIEGIAAGVRNSAQRDWKEFGVLDGATVPASTMSFVLPGAFDLQESVLRVSECGSACGLLSSIAKVAREIPARITFSFVGRDLDGPRVRQVARRAPGADLDDDLATCANVRQLLPHDPSTPATQGWGADRPASP